MSAYCDGDTYRYPSARHDVVRPRLTAAASMTPLKTAEEIRGVMNALKLDEVASYFDKDDEVDPYVVCDKVSVITFNEYVGDGEGLRIALRFLALDDGHIVIVDLPTCVHESTAAEFTSKFLRAAKNEDEIAKRGSVTARRAANPNKEADATFGPKGSTPLRTPPPAPRTISDWLTLAVEVGRSQSWVSLTDAARWWFGYAGIQYVLLLKISAPGTQIQYALYDCTTRPTPTIRPTASGNFRHNAAGAVVNVTFDMRRILSIPANQALPTGINAIAVIDLRAVMNQVIRSLR